MTPTITPELVEAYSQCPRKAFLLMAGVPKPDPHGYVRIIDEQRAANRKIHRENLEKSGELSPDGNKDLTSGAKVLADKELEAKGLYAYCEFLTKVNEASKLGRFSYEPQKVIGTYHASRQDMLGLAFQGLVLSEVQGYTPSSGSLVLLDRRSTKINMASKIKEVRKIVDALRAWSGKAAGDAPEVILNKHCPSCPFRDACLRQAEKEDTLSLLDRMTSKLMRKYHNKGIFTVKQLSHIFRPRRSRKKAKRQLRHCLELQALAIRTEKIYVEHLPELLRNPVELFLDMEGVPDSGLHYLTGLIVCRSGNAEYESFWTDDVAGEAAMWSALIERLSAYPDSPIYHYGSYEKKAFAILSKRHSIGSGVGDRLVNVASSVYGKVYFPVRSNGLKTLARFLGATWTDSQASGLQSLVWRHLWDATKDESFKLSLLQYNREDCEAVRLLVDRLDKIRLDASSDPAIEFSRQPKRYTTEIGNAVHGHFERILQSAQLEFAHCRINILEMTTEEIQKKNESSKSRQPYRRIAPNKRQIVIVDSVQRCPKDDIDLEPPYARPLSRIEVDLVFTKSGCRKRVRKYVSFKRRCPICEEYYSSELFRGSHRQLFGHAFQAWVVYQRIILRLPYRIIVQVMDHLFGIGISTFTTTNFLRYLADYYTPTQGYLLQAILKSDFVHVDETKISIKGVDHYVWVFTDGKHVVFRMTESREANIVHEVLAGYKGVLISDFYPGYDGVPCRQQKCLVHLIRDINDDLWKNPFDKELEAFSVEIQSLLVPILVAVERFGLKVWHLRKFLKDVNRFYEKQIIGREYVSEPTRIFQKRFERYRESLFMFLTQDGIPWENNMAERAIRQLAVQRKISGSFSKRYAGYYLQMLAISQSCRFQDKSFLKFLLSKENDLSSFRRA